MCLPQVIKSFQNYRGVATTFYPTLVYQYIGPTVLSIARARIFVTLVQIYVIPSLIGRCYLFTRCVVGIICTSHRLDIPSATPDDASSCLNYTVAHVYATKAYKESRGLAPLTLNLDPR